MSRSTFGRIVLKIWICGWSGDGPDSATAYVLTGSVETTHTLEVSGKHVCLRSGCGAGRPLAANTAR